MVILVISAVVGTSGTVIWIRSIMVQKRRKSDPSSEIIKGMHTGLISSISFQNYDFKGCLSLETTKLWLLVLIKTLFLMTLIIKLTLVGQHFHRSEKSARWRHRHKIIKTNLKTLVTPLLSRPQKSNGYQKMRQDLLNMQVEVWCTKVAPKLKNIRKGLRKQPLCTRL